MPSNTTSKNTDKAAEVETIPVKVDGAALDVPKTMPDPLTGKPIPTTMIQACNLAKVEVPHYCYHPKLPVAGNCRMCLVEFGVHAMGPDRKPRFNEDGTPVINKMPRPAIACATPISPNMEIYTSTPGVKQMREGVLEFLLINHPLDCPICDQAGECKLQEYSVEYGQAKSRFVEQKVHKPKQVDLGPRIMLDDERCILCSRCIRFTKDIAGDDALGFVNRGGHSTLTHYPGKPFDNNYTLNTVDICPVGALTSKDFRFQMRVWFLKETHSICTSCGTGCNIVIGAREGKVRRYEPRENDAVNSCWMCDYGRLNYKWIGREDRLNTPMIRERKNLRAAGWKESLDRVASVLEKAEPESSAMIVSARLSNEELYLLRLLAKKLNAVTDSIARSGEGDHLLLNEDRNPNTNGVRIMGLSGKRPGSRLKKIKDGIEAGTIKTLLVFGEDVVKHGLEAETLSRLDHLIVSDILPSETAALAHVVLPGCAHAEKQGSFVNVKGRLQRFWKSIEGPGEARPEWEFLHELTAKVAEGNGWSTVEGLFNQMARDIGCLNGVRWADLGNTGVDIEV